MAQGDETIGFGGIFEVNDGGGGSFQVVPKVISLGIPNETVGIVESKRLDLSGAVIKKLATLKNGGSIAVKIENITGTWDRFEAIRSARLEKQWRFTIPLDEGNKIITVPGILTSNKHDALEAEKINEFEATIEVSGAAL